MAQPNVPQNPKAIPKSNGKAATGLTSVPSDSLSMSRKGSPQRKNRAQHVIVIKKALRYLFIEGFL